MSSRDAILSRIRNALAHDPQRSLPPVPEVWPRENPTIDAMAARFQRELEEVHGEFVRCGTMEGARKWLAETAARESWEKIGGFDRALCREACGGLRAERVLWTGHVENVPHGGAENVPHGGAENVPHGRVENVPHGFDWTPLSMAELSAGIVEADHLLADTGTAMVACGQAVERLLCYLPPACIVVATADRLVEHLPAAWPAIAPRVADPQTRGEFVFITGPSRTADIEKILILGVHGPKRLIVLLVG